jgi:hypothetical protein
VIGNIVSNNVIGCLLIRHSTLIIGNLTVKDFVGSIFQINRTVNAYSLFATTAQQITQYNNKVIPQMANLNSLEKVELILIPVLLIAAVNLFVPFLLQSH